MVSFLSESKRRIQKLLARVWIYDSWTYDSWFQEAINPTFVYFSTLIHHWAPTGHGLWGVQHHWLATVPCLALGSARTPVTVAPGSLQSSAPREAGITAMQTGSPCQCQALVSCHLSHYHTRWASRTPLLAASHWLWESYVLLPRPAEWPASPGPYTAIDPLSLPTPISSFS